MKELVFIGLSFVMGAICIRYIQSYDKHEKESFLRMFAVVCWGGIWSMVIAWLLYAVVARLGATDLENAYGALFVIGPVEEMAKLLAFLSGYFIIRRDMNEPVDGIIYISCVALGFSLIENYFYAMAPGSGHLLLFRLFISTPMHICFSAFMGLAAYIALKNKKAAGLLVFSFALAAISHGIYDLVIFNGWALLLLLAVMRGIYQWTMALLSYATANSPFRSSLKDFIENYENPVLQEGIECLNCGSRNSKMTYAWGKIYIQKCDGCDHYVTTRKSLLAMFHHFAATFKNVSGKHIAAAFRNKTNQICKKKKIAAFELDALDLTLDALNRSISRQLEKKWWLPGTLMILRNKDQASHW